MESGNKNSVIPISLKNENHSSTGDSADLKNIILYTSAKGHQKHKCQAVIENGTLMFRQLESNGRYTVLSEFHFDDFIGIELTHQKMGYMEGGNLSMRAVSTVPEPGCCFQPANEKQRKVFWSREYHGATDKVIHTARNIIMQSWWDWMKEHHGIGIPADDPSYVHPPNLHPWERKA